MFYCAKDRQKQRNDREGLPAPEVFGVFPAHQAEEIEVTEATRTDDMSFGD